MPFNPTATGHDAEQTASEGLERLGYEVVDRNWHSKYCMHFTANIWTNSHDWVGETNIAAIEVCAPNFTIGEILLIAYTS